MINYETVAEIPLKQCLKYHWTNSTFCFYYKCGNAVENKIVSKIVSKISQRRSKQLECLSNNSGIWFYNMNSLKLNYKTVSKNGRYCLVECFYWISRHSRSDMSDVLIVDQVEIWIVGFSIFFEWEKVDPEK